MNEKNDLEDTKLSEINYKLYQVKNALSTLNNINSSIYTLIMWGVWTLLLTGSVLVGLIITIFLNL